jgi:diadenylate cyclase
MASRRIGALIALEREASLEDYADGGNRLDARVSSELFLATFHPTSPLHDGAAVVRKDRVLAAKVFLPLSLSKDVSRFYGTRHRAAIGLTEETDAVVVIVSEERGTVSLVLHGEVQPVADQNEMRERLLECFQPQVRGRKRAG